MRYLFALALIAGALPLPSMLPQQPPRSIAGWKSNAIGSISKKFALM